MKHATEMCFSLPVIQPIAKLPPFAIFMMSLLIQDHTVYQTELASESTFASNKQRIQPFQWEQDI